MESKDGAEREHKSDLGVAAPPAAVKVAKAAEAGADAMAVDGAAAGAAAGAVPPRSCSNAAQNAPTSRAPGHLTDTYSDRGRTDRTETVRDGAGRQQGRLPGLPVPRCVCPPPLSSALFCVCKAPSTRLRRSRPLDRHAWWRRLHPAHTVAPGTPLHPSDKTAVDLSADLKSRPHAVLATCLVPLPPASS